MQDKKYKIALVGYRLTGGGLEKVMANLSFLFSSHNIEVYTIVLEDYIEYPISGTLVNIGAMTFSNNKLIAKLKAFLYLRNYIATTNFDYIIDFRYRLKPLKELLYSLFVFNSKTIYTIHNSKLETYLPNNTIVTKIITKNKTLVCVSNEIKALVQQKHHLPSTTIYNPIDLISISKKAGELIILEFEYVLAIGRKNDKKIKQLDSLITAYSKTILPSKNIKLVLLGVGKINPTLKAVAELANVGHQVVFLDFDPNPYKYMVKAKFLVLCSKHEGFPMSIIEALACETPVISFNCVSGPKEIITDKENGLLVENQNFEKLTLAMNEFVTNNALYDFCKKNSRHSVSKFSIEKIGQQWLDLLKIDLN